MSTKTRKPLINNNGRYDVTYEGKEINKTKVVFDNETQEYKVWNAVYLPEKPKHRTLASNKYFAKSFLKNKEQIMRSWTGKVKKGSTDIKLSGYDLGILALIETFITWENNIIYDLEKKSYITASGLADITEYDVDAVMKSLKRLAALGIIFFIKGMRKEKYIMLNPYIAYMGEKMEQWVYEIISNQDLPYQPIARVVFDVIPSAAAVLYKDKDSSPKKIEGLDLSNAVEGENETRLLTVSDTANNRVSNAEEIIVLDAVEAVKEEPVIDVDIDDLSEYELMEIRVHALNLANAGNYDEADDYIVMTRNTEWINSYNSLFYRTAGDNNE